MTLTQAYELAMAISKYRPDWAILQIKFGSGYDIPDGSSGYVLCIHNTRDSINVTIAESDGIDHSIDYLDYAVQYHTAQRANGITREAR